MSFLGRFFRKKQEEDYETILSSLALDIQKRQVKLSEIRLRERRSTLLVTLYTLAGWVAYVSLWYMSVLPNISGHAKSSKPEKAAKGFPVVLGPVIILFVRRIVQVWYKRKGDAEEKTLQSLLKQQRTKVEEIKKKTNYYSTRDLIQRYDEPASSPVFRPNQRLVQGPTQPSTPQRPVVQQPTKPDLQTPNPFNPTPISMAVSPPLPAGPPRKQWYDKLADALLGDEDNGSGTSKSQYALICEKCFAHNGLVKESMWEDAQYVCPKCDHFNPSARAKRQNHQRVSSSPTSTPSTSPRSVTPNAVQRQPSPAQNDSPPNGKDTSMMEVDDS